VINNVLITLRCNEEEECNCNKWKVYYLKDGKYLSSTETSCCNLLLIEKELMNSPEWKSSIKEKGKNIVGNINKGFENIIYEGICSAQEIYLVLPEAFYQACIKELKKRSGCLNFVPASIIQLMLENIKLDMEEGEVKFPTIWDESVVNEIAEDTIHDTFVEYDELISTK
jgi:hypothetical protein